VVSVKVEENEAEDNDEEEESSSSEYLYSSGQNKEEGHTPQGSEDEDHNNGPNRQLSLSPPPGALIPPKISEVHISVLAHELPKVTPGISRSQSFAPSSGYQAHLKAPDKRRGPSASVLLTIPAEEEENKIDSNKQLPEIVQEQYEEENEELVEYLTTLHPYPMIGPYLWSSDSKPYCEYKFCMAKLDSTQFVQGYFKSQTFGDEYRLCVECVISHPRENLRFMSIAPEEEEEVVNTEVNRKPAMEGWLKKKAKNSLKAGKIVGVSCMKIKNYIIMWILNHKMLVESLI